MPSDSFERYRPIVDDWDAFRRALTRPLPTCVWTNTLRTTPALVAERLRRAGLAPLPLGWHPGAFRLPPDVGPGTRLAFVAGLLHVQEEVSLLPVHLLDPQPGERILDLCAAPGNKTAQIGVAMGNRGTVVANDWNAGRSRAVNGILERLGVSCACTTTCNAANYPAASGTFDRVLADVPCTCEGTTRKHPDLLTEPAAHRKRLTGLQRAILRKAVHRCRPGGRIVYATCTYAPEENEMIVDAILREYGPGRLRLLPARIDGFDGTGGLTEWNGTRLDPSLHLALRAWPHRTDSGGFFVAVLEKGQADAGEADAPPLALPPADRALLDAVQAYFGFPPHALQAFALTPGSRGQLALVPRGMAPPMHPIPETLGMPFLRIDGRTPKLSSAAALALGHLATRNVLDVTRAQAEAFLRREAFRTDASQTTRASSGYVILRHDAVSLGVGLLRGASRLVESTFPKAWAIAQLT